MSKARGRGSQPAALAGWLLVSAVLALSSGFGSAFGAPATKPPQPKPATAAPAKKVTTPAQRCSDLESQFDVALPKHSDSKSLTSAQKLRADGQRLCDAGQHAAGALRLVKALADLGVKPEVN
jgi:hypothetical protein